MRVTPREPVWLALTRPIIGPHLRHRPVRMSEVLVPGEEPRRAPSTADPLLERRSIPEAGDRPGPVVVTPETLVPLPDELSFEVGAAVSRGTDTA